MTPSPCGRYVVAVYSPPLVGWAFDPSYWMARVPIPAGQILHVGIVLGLS